LKVPPSTPAETQELEARQTAHLRASRFSKEKIGGFSKKLNARKRKINMCGSRLPRRFIRRRHCEGGSLGEGGSPRWKRSIIRFSNEYG